MWCGGKAKSKGIGKKTKGRGKKNSFIVCWLQSVEL
jgi:hypothetical protein